MSRELRGGGGGVWEIDADRGEGKWRVEKGGSSGVEQKGQEE